MVGVPIKTFQVSQEFIVFTLEHEFLWGWYEITLSDLFRSSVPFWYHIGSAWHARFRVTPFTGELVT